MKPRAAPAVPPEPGAAPRRAGSAALRRVAVAMALVLTATLVAAAGLLGTQAGTRWLVAWAHAAGLEVGRTSGTVLHGLQMNAVRWQSATTTVTVDALRWRLRPAALTHGRIDLGTLDASGVAISVRSTSDAPTDPLVWPRLRVPLPVHVRALALRDVSIERDGAVLLRHGELRASGRLRASRLELAVHSLHADALHLRGTVRVGFDARGALGSALAWEYIAAPDRRWAGDLDLRGAVSGKVSVHHQLIAPAPVTLSAEIATPLTPGRWSAVLELPDTALAAFGAPEAWRGRATLRAGGQGAAGRISGDFALADTPAGPLTGQLLLHGANTAWTLEALHLNGPDAARVDLSGKADFAATPTGQVHARWQALRWPVSGPAGVHAKAGELTVEGTVDTWRFVLDTALEGRYGGPGQLRARGSGSGQAVQVEALDAEVLDGTLAGTARLVFGGEPAWKYDLTARALNPGRVHADWPGAVDARLQGDGRVRAAAISQRTSLAALGGQLRGHALAGSGTVHQEGAMIRAENVALRMGTARLALDGTLTDGLHLRVQIPQLAGLLPDASGAVQADLTVSGTPPALGVSGTASAQALAYADWRVGTLRADVDFAPGAPDRLVLDVQAQDLAGPLALTTVRAQAGPKASAHDITVNARAPDWRASARARGGIGMDNTWRGTLRHAQWQAPDAQTWTLDAPAALTVGARAQSLARACLVSAGARVCTAGENAAGTYAAQAELAALPVRALAALLPPDVQVEGLLTGTAAVRGAPGAPPQGDLALNLSAGTWRLARPSQEPLEFAHGGARADLRFDAAATVVAARVTQPTGTRVLLDAQLRLPAPLALSEPDAPLAGRITVRDLSVTPLAALSPDLDELAGAVNADLKLAGRVAAPTLRGQARLENGRVTLPRLGTDIRDIRLTVRAQDDSVLRIDGQARSGKGTLGIAGSFALDAARGYPLDLDIHGTDFLASDTTEARVLISPALSVRSTRQRITVRGELAVPEAMLRPAGNMQAARSSPDVVVVGRSDAAEPSPWTIDAEVTVRLGEKVRLAYAGLATQLVQGVQLPGYALDVRLGGQLAVRDQPGELTRASGAIDVEEGSLSAYGQRLNITRGRLRFADQPLDNPGLSLEAQRKVGDVSAGLRVRGRLQSPTLTVFSDPPMAQEEALSYVILGRPLRGASQAEASMLAQAAGALGVSRGDRLAKRIGARLGLDEIGVSSAEAGSGVQGVALQAGKYLSPRLYVGYGLGLFDQVGAFKVRFELTERWVLEATSGLGQAVDLLYTRER